MIPDGRAVGNYRVMIPRKCKKIPSLQALEEWDCSRPPNSNNPLLIFLSHI